LEAREPNLADVAAADIAQLSVETSRDIEAGDQPRYRVEAIMPQDQTAQLAGGLREIGRPPGLDELMPVVVPGFIWLLCILWCLAGAFASGLLPLVAEGAPWSMLFCA
jgi:hypothetical protein